MRREGLSVVDAGPQLRDRVAAALPSLRAFAIPMRTRFRGIAGRAGGISEGPAGWAEFSPFAEYGPRECARWLACALEAAYDGWPAPVRDRDRKGVVFGQSVGFGGTR